MNLTNWSQQRLTQRQSQVEAALYDADEVRATFERLYGPVHPHLDAHERRLTAEYDAIEAEYARRHPNVTCAECGAELPPDSRPRCADCHQISQYSGPPLTEEEQARFEQQSLRWVR